MTWSVEVVPAPVPGEPASPLIEAYAEVCRRDLVRTYGDDDLADSARAIAVNYSQQQIRRKLLVVARTGDRVMGGAFFGMPLRDNRTLAEGDVAVDPAADLRTVLRALWGAARPLLVAQGRGTVQVWTAHSLTGPGEPLVPRSGVGRLSRDLRAVSLLELGFVLEQVERHSALEVAPSRAVAQREGAVARAAAGPAYEVLGWTGPTPPEHRAGMAEIRARMSTDVPSGELEIELEEWDADRVAEADRITERMGTRTVTTAARHVGTGRIVAYTMLESPADAPWVAYQGDTLVHGEHRGHRLGLWVKAANLQRLARELPAVQRVHTWNAGENAHMLAINHTLGFTDRTAEGAWQVTGLRA